MLIKMLVGKRKTEDEFKKYITRVACSLLSLGVLGLFISLIIGSNIHLVKTFRMSKRRKIID